MISNIDQGQNKCCEVRWIHKCAVYYEVAITKILNLTVTLVSQPAHQSLSHSVSLKETLVKNYLKMWNIQQIQDRLT